MGSPTLELIGWLIVHSLWQFALIAALAWGTVDLLLRRSTASLRYAALGIALLAVLACPIVTTIWLRPTSATPAAVAKERPPLAETPQFIPSPAPPQVAAKQPADVPADLATAAANSPIIVAADLPWLDRVAADLRPWLRWIAFTWSGGVCLVGLRLLIAWRRIEHLKRTGRAIADATLETRLLAAMRKLRINRPVQVLVSDWIESPVVVGMLRSVILVPTSFLSGVSPDHLEAILAHELAHVRRYDYVANVAQMILEALFFYHPCVWWISHRLRIEREHCCDDLAAAVTASPVAYSRALVALAELGSSNVAAGVGAGGGSLRGRILRLVAPPVRRDSLASGRLVVAVIACTIAGLLWTCAPALQAEDAKPVEKDKFTVKLDDGLAVEMIAVMPHGQTEDQAWNPDGSPYQPPADAPRRTSSFEMDAPNAVEIFFRFRGLTDEMRPIYEIDKLQGWRNPYDGGNTVLYAIPPQNAKSGDIAVGVPDRQFGPWRKLNAQGELIEPIILKPQFQQAYAAIRVQEIRPLTTRVMLCWGHSNQEERLANLELFAVDKTGKRLKTWGNTAWQDPDGEVHRADVFDLPIDQVDHFEYQLCPIREWVTFKNVPFQPGEKTEVAIERQTVEIPQANGTTATFRGRIVNQDGSPATAKGWLYYQARSSSGSYVGLVGQHQDSFEVQQQAGSVFFSYFPAGYAPAWTPRLGVEPGDVVEGLTLTLQPGVSATLEIRNEAGEPIPAASVVAAPEIHGSTNGPVLPNSADASGKLTLSHLARTSYSFRVTAPGYEELRLDSQQVSPAQPLTLSMRKAAPAVGFVRNAEGEPAVGARLRTLLEILPDGSTNFIYGDQGNASLGKIVATTDQLGRFSIDQLSRDRRYLFLIEGADESRMIYRDLRAGQQDLTINLPVRRDLQLELRGDLGEYFPADAAPAVQIVQQFAIETDNGNASTAIGADAAIKRNDTGGTVVYRGLIVDPEAEQQTADVKFGTLKRTTKRLQLSHEPLTSQTLQVGPIPAKPIDLPNAADETPTQRKSVWRAQGKVTDEFGHPLEGVTIRASSGIGTLLGATQTQTDADGRYELDFPPGMRFSPNPDGTPSAWTQYAIVSAWADGLCEQNLSRHGNGVKSLRPVAQEELTQVWQVSENQVCLPDQPREVDFVMIRAAQVSGVLVDEAGQPLTDYSVSVTGDALPPASSVIEEVRTDAQGRFMLTRVPTNYVFQLEVRNTRDPLQPPFHDSWASPPIRFLAPGDNDLRMTLSDDPQAAADADTAISAQEFRLQLIGAGVHGKAAVRNAKERRWPEAKTKSHWQTLTLTLRNDAPN